jgi:hypothetical protein
VVREAPQMLKRIEGTLPISRSLEYEHHCSNTTLSVTTRAVSIVTADDEASLTGPLVPADLLPEVATCQSLLR